jgi:formylglycine-generating enzyme required for sulfatase activity
MTTNPAKVFFLVAFFTAAGEVRSFEVEGVRVGEARSFGGVEMVWCPPGKFLMGSPEGAEEGRYDNETLHQVTLTRGFWLAKTETTQGQWEALTGSNPSKFKGSSLPVESVSWVDVQEWLQEMSARHPLPTGWKWDLPTEAQWEYACRAETTEAFAMELYKVAWYGFGESNGITFSVAQKKPNAWGIHDMHGNVAEWCQDWFGDYPIGSTTDPLGLKDGSDRVVRGGSWISDLEHCRSAVRLKAEPDARGSGVGFRVAIISTLPSEPLGARPLPEAPKAKSEGMRRLADQVRGATKEAPFVNSLGLEFVPVPGEAGVFLCRTETRVRDFRAYAEATDYVQTGGAYVLKFEEGKPSFQLDEAASWEKPGFEQSEDHPVVCVSWEEARAMAAWLSGEEPGVIYRLPTDAEWSAAVGSVGKYPWGNSWPPPVGSGNYFGKEGPRNWPGSGWNTAYTSDDGAERTARIASYTENRFGFFDLGGNVFEWCEDPYRASMNDADVLEAYPILKKEKDSEGTPYRGLRGGCWRSSVEIGLRSSFRCYDRPTGRIAFYGFRFVVSVGVGG